MMIKGHFAPGVCFPFCKRSFQGRRKVAVDCAERSQMSLGRPERMKTGIRPPQLGSWLPTPKAGGVGSPAPGESSPNEPKRRCETKPMLKCNARCLPLVNPGAVAKRSQCQNVTPDLCRTGRSAVAKRSRC